MSTTTSPLTLSAPRVPREVADAVPGVSARSVFVDLARAGAILPNQFLLRSGLVLVVVGLLAHISRLLSRPPLVIQALAHESLTTYAVHLCVVYGSVWNAGLRQHVGPTLTLLPAFGYVAAVWVSMTALAAAWYWCKYHKPGTAQWVRVATGGLLLGRLL